MTIEKEIQILGLRAFLCLGCQLAHLSQLFRTGFLPGEREGEGFQLDANIEDLFRIHKTELRNLSASERRALHKALVLELDQCLPDQSLSHAELLRDFPFNNLFTRLKRS